MLIATTLYFCFLASMITLWAARGRPLWGGVGLLVWFVVNFVFAAGVDPNPSSTYAPIRAGIIVALVVLLCVALDGVRRIEKSVSDARRRSRDFS
jgi:hypothetical protein